MFERAKTNLWTRQIRSKDGDAKPQS